MKKFLVGLLLLGVSVSAFAVSEPYNSHASTQNSNVQAGRQTSSSLASQSENSETSSNDDTAAIINTSLSALSTVDTLLGMFTSFTITGKINEYLKDWINDLFASEVSKEYNCPQCAAELAAPGDAATYEARYASFLLACETMAPILIKPGSNESKSYEDTTCPACTASLGLKWPPFLFVAPDIMGLVISGVKLATTYFLQDGNKIIAELTGDEGHLTYKYTGSGGGGGSGSDSGSSDSASADVTKTVGDVSVDSYTFESLAFDASEYEGISAPEKASWRELFDYRSNQVIEDQRTLKNVTEKNLRLLYRAQQRSIKAMARAMELKHQLSVLADVDSKIDAKYDNLPQSLAAEASRRALYGALTQLKLSVAAARTKTRSEALELEFKPLTKSTETSTLSTGSAGVTDGGFR